MATPADSESDANLKMADYGPGADFSDDVHPNFDFQAEPLAGSDFR